MRNEPMYYAAGFLLSCVLYKIYRHYKRMPGCALLVYIAVLATDLLVGGSIIVWKCSISKIEEECDLAIGGTIGSLVIWLLVMLVCPCFATRCEICLTLENIQQTCAKYMKKLRPEESKHVSLTDIAHGPTSIPLIQKGQGHAKINGDAKKHLENGFRGNFCPQVHICNGRNEAKTNGYAIKYLQTDDP